MTPADTLQYTIEPLPPAIWWIPVNQTVAIVALALAVVIFIISYFAGGKENKGRILFSYLFASVSGILVMPLLIKAGTWLGLLNNDWGVTVLVMIDFVFIAAVAVNIYEIIIVTAREARPPQ